MFSHSFQQTFVFFFTISTLGSVPLGQSTFLIHTKVKTHKISTNKQTKLVRTIRGPNYLCMKAMRSAARPEPSQTTTGTGGSSVTYSRTARIVFVPPSMTSATTGILLCVSGIYHSSIKLEKFDKIERSDSHMDVASDSKCISPIFYAALSQLRICLRFRYRPEENTRVCCSAPRI